MKKVSLILVSAILLSYSVFAQTVANPSDVKATLRPADRKIIDPNVGIVRAPVPPANEHYKSILGNKPSAPALTQSIAPVKASTPLPIITSAQSRMTHAMTTPVSGKVSPGIKTGQPKVPNNTSPSKYKGRRISGAKAAPKIARSSSVRAKPKTLRPVAKKPQDGKEKMYNSIYPK